MQRRRVLQGLAWSGAVASLGGCAATSGAPSSAKVVVVGGGYGGATAAKYIRMWSAQAIDVVLVEPQPAIRVLPDVEPRRRRHASLADVTTPYDGLRNRHGVTIVRDSVSAIDSRARTVTLAGGGTIRYDKLVLSPGVELMFDGIEGLRAANAEGRIVQAWNAGAETLALRRQLEAMGDGGIYAITIPEQPYRCPPGPYERASVVAAYFKAAKPRSKVLILDANADVTSKAGLFKSAWSELYPGMVEYRSQHSAIAVDARTLTVKFEVHEDVKADVLNVLPPMRAGEIAVKTGLANANTRWCMVDYQTFESTAAKDIHVVGDSIQVAPLMPKSGHMANSHAKVAAAAIVAQLSGDQPIARPLLTNTCYSFVSAEEVIHVASVHEYVAAEKTFKTVAGSGGVSAARSQLEASYAMAWARNIWADCLA